MFKENISLKPYSHYKIGGNARYFFEAKNISDTRKAVEVAQKKKLQTFILAGGTNLLISDTGFNGLVLRPALNYIKKENGNVVRVGCGAQIKDLLDFLIKNNLSGMEWAGGLPGTVGGAVRGNAGAFGGEIKDSVKVVTSIDVSKSKPILLKRKGEDCKFSYRSSIFKDPPAGGSNKEIILEVELALKRGKKVDIENNTKEKINYRFNRHPMEYPNIGSIFKNVDLKKFPASKLNLVRDKIKRDPMPLVPTAVLLSHCNLKGVSFGGAMFSPKHPNFIVNVLNATSGDVEKLISLAKKEVYKKFKVKLEEEIVRV